LGSCKTKQHGVALDLTGPIGEPVRDNLAKEDTMAEETKKGKENLLVRSAVGETKIGEIRLTLDGDPALRGSIEGFRSKMDSLLREQLAALSCCFHGCCVSFCCVRIT